MNTEEQDPRNARYPDGVNAPAIAANPEPVLTEEQIALRAEISSKPKKEIGDMAAKFGVDIDPLLESGLPAGELHAAIVDAVATAFEACKGRPITEDPSGGPETGTASENTGSGSTPVDSLGFPLSEGETIETPLDESGSSTGVQESSQLSEPGVVEGDIADSDFGDEDEDFDDESDDEDLEETADKA